MRLRRPWSAWPIVPIAFAAVTISGCAEPPSVPSIADRLHPATTATCSKGNFSFFVASWNCSETVYFYPTSLGIADQLDDATDKWLSAANIPGLPQFYTTLVPGNASAWVSGPNNPNGAGYCGQWSESTKNLTIHGGTACSGFTNTGTVDQVLLHELGHAFGWTSNFVHKAGVTGVSDHCVMTLPASGGLNSTICSQEIEGAAVAYGLRTLPSDFWSREFIAGSASPLLPDTLAAGDTLRLDPGPWRLDRGGTVADNGYQWSSSNTAVATVVGGLVQGVSPGVATIRAIPNSSSAYLFATHFSTMGVSVPITVTPMAPANLYVTSITRSGNNDEPIHEPGTYLLTAHLGAGDTTGITFRWTIIFSNALGDSVVAPTNTLPPWGGPTYSITIPDPVGSYTVTARVLSARDSLHIAPGQTSVDFPVCPVPPGNDRRTGTNEGTDAVGGC